MHKHTYIYVYVTHVRAFICLCLCTCTCTYVCICNLHVGMYIYVHYMYVYTYICMYVTFVSTYTFERYRSYWKLWVKHLGSGTCLPTTLPRSCPGSSASWPLGCGREMPKDRPLGLTVGSKKLEYVDIGYRYIYGHIYIDIE